MICIVHFVLLLSLRSYSVLWCSLQFRKRLFCWSLSLLFVVQFMSYCDVCLRILVSNIMPYRILVSNIMPYRLLVSNIMPYRLLMSNILPYRILVSNIMPYRILVSNIMPYRILVSNIMPHRILVSNIMPYHIRNRKSIINDSVNPPSP